MSSTRNSHWERNIPWFLTITSCLVLIAIGLFLIENLDWFRDNVFEIVKDDKSIPRSEYAIHAFHMHLAMIKRSVGLFSGFSIMFLGTGVVFYTIRSQNKVTIESANISGSLVTASPGIIAMILGAILIIVTINSKDEFPYYEEIRKEQTLDPGLKEQPNGKD